MPSGVGGLRGHKALASIVEHRSVSSCDCQCRLRVNSPPAVQACANREGYGLWTGHPQGITLRLLSLGPFQQLFAKCSINGMYPGSDSSCHTVTPLINLQFSHRPQPSHDVNQRESKNRTQYDTARHNRAQYDSIRNKLISQPTRLRALAAQLPFAKTAVWG